MFFPHLNERLPPLSLLHFTSDLNSFHCLLKIKREMRRWGYQPARTRILPMDCSSWFNKDSLLLDHAPISGHIHTISQQPQPCHNQVLAQKKALEPGYSLSRIDSTLGISLAQQKIYIIVAAIRTTESFL